MWYFPQRRSAKCYLASKSSCFGRKCKVFARATETLGWNVLGLLGCQRCLQDVSCFCKHSFSFAVEMYDIESIQQSNFEYLSHNAAGSKVWNHLQYHFASTHARAIQHPLPGHYGNRRSSGVGGTAAAFVELYLIDLDCTVSPSKMPCQIFLRNSCEIQLNYQQLPAGLYSAATVLVS